MLPYLNTSILFLLSIFTTVDSRPRVDCLSFKTKIFFSKIGSISIILVTEVLSDRLALGAAIGISNKVINLLANLLLGILQPTKFDLLETKFDILEFFFFFNIIVKGPGQNFEPNFFSNLLKSKYFSIWFISLKWQIIGLFGGLFFTLKIDFTALSFVASAPMPNTVSVGNITSSPPLNNFFAKSNLFFFIFFYKMFPSIFKIVIINSCIWEKL